MTSLEAENLLDSFHPPPFFFLLLQLSFHRITGIWAKEIVHVDLTFFLPSFSLSLPCPRERSYWSDRSNEIRWHKREGMTEVEGGRESRTMNKLSQLPVGPPSCKHAQLVYLIDMISPLPTLRTHTKKKTCSRNCCCRVAILAVTLRLLLRQVDKRSCVGVLVRVEANESPHRLVGRYNHSSLI